MTAVSKSGLSATAGAWTIKIAMSSFCGSIQKCVPDAPVHPKLPFDNQLFLAAAFETTRTLSPQLSPACLPGSVSGTCAPLISATLLGLSNRRPSSSPLLRSISENLR